MIRKEDINVGDVITIRGKRHGSVTSGEVCNVYTKNTGELCIVFKDPVFHQIKVCGNVSYHIGLDNDNYELIDIPDPIPLSDYIAEESEEEICGTQCYRIRL